MKRHAIASRAMALIKVHTIGTYPWQELSTLEAACRLWTQRDNRELICPVCLEAIRAGDRVRGRDDNFIHESCDHYTRVWSRLKASPMTGSRSVWGALRLPPRHSLSRRLAGR